MKARQVEAQCLADRVADLHQLSDATVVVIFQRTSPSIEDVSLQVSERVVSACRSGRAQPHCQIGKPMCTLLGRSVLGQSEPVTRHIDTRLSLAREPRGLDGAVVA
jgi:hypothetical protein